MTSDEWKAMHAIRREKPDLVALDLMLPQRDGLEITRIVRSDEALAAIPILMLTHDPKLDDPALKIALPSEAFYVGALGSRVTQEQRRQRMLTAGISESNLAKLHGPIGIELGGQTPEEIALAVMAEIIAVRSGQSPDILTK